MRYDVYFTRRAKKELDELEPETRRRILDKLIILRDYGFTVRLISRSLGDIKTIIDLELVTTVFYSS